MSKTETICKLMMGDTVLGDLRHHFYDMPWSIDYFKPTAAYQPIAHLFERENQLYDEIRRLQDLLHETPESEELAAQLDNAQSMLDQVELEIETLQLSVDCGVSRREIATIHIRDGKADYKPHFR